MMNKVTRRLSKMPEEVRGEIAPWFIDRHAIQEEAAEKIIKLDSNAMYIHSDLKVSSPLLTSLGMKLVFSLN
jgi:fatty acyl-ACP thioesterase B